MNLALAIVCLWVGAALLWVAFHPLQVEAGESGPHQVLQSLQAAVVNRGGAYEGA
jgi:hypothetical protein